MQTIKQYAEANNIQPNKLLNYLIPKYPKAGLKLESALPEDFAQYADDIAKIAEKVQEQTKTPPVANIGESAITTVDEAVQTANYKLTEAHKVTVQQTIDIENTGMELLGKATGVNSALKFLEGMVEGNQIVFNQVNENKMGQLEETLEEINQSAFSLSNTASSYLGKQITLQQRLQEKMNRLQQNVAKMGAVTQLPK
jgi:hypothetical protein